MGLAALVVLAVVAGPPALAWLADVWTGRRPLDAVAFRVGPVAVHWYGILIAFSFIPGWMLAQPERGRIGLSVDELLDAAALGIPLGLAGARAGFVIQNLDYFAEHPGDIFRTWMGGLSIHGVLAGVGFAILMFSRRRRVSAAALADLAAPSVLLGQAIGRWGNFFNHEVVGYPTSRPWGFYVPPELRPPGWAGAAYFHPAFLYESVWNALGVAALVAYRRRRERRSGEVAALYLIIYSAGRFLVEFWRIGEPLALGLTLAQWVSLGAAAAGAAWRYTARQRARAVVE